MQALSNNELGAFCHGEEESDYRACTNSHLTTADQCEMLEGYLTLNFREKIPALERAVTLRF